jgi:hypothetical protein
MHRPIIASTVVIRARVANERAPEMAGLNVADFKIDFSNDFWPSREKGYGGEIPQSARNSSN